MEGVFWNPARLREAASMARLRAGRWESTIDVRDFIQRNVTPYQGDESFLAGPSVRHGGLGQAATLFRGGTAPRRARRGCGDAVHHLPMRQAGSTRRTRSSSACRRIAVPSRDLSRRRAAHGGAGLKAAGFEADPAVHQAFTQYRKTHNDGVFDAYTPEIMNCRRSGIITGLPDAYGRGRIIGDYRRVALYGVDRLIARSAKSARRSTTCGPPMR